MIIRNRFVWPTLLLFNVFTDLKGTHLYTFIRTYVNDISLYKTYVLFPLFIRFYCYGNTKFLLIYKMVFERDLNEPRVEKTCRVFRPDPTQIGLAQMTCICLDINMCSFQVGAMRTIITRPYQFYLP